MSGRPQHTPRVGESPARRRAKRAVRRAFEVFQGLGVNVVPHHFYSQLPDIRELKGTHEWREPRSMTAVKGLELTSQLEFARDCCRPEALGPLNGRDIFAEACNENGAHGFGPIEALFLYCFIATHRPSRVVQVGSGVSTSVILRAMADHGVDCAITCIDPYPTEFLRRADREGRISLVAEPAQAVPIALLTELGPGDLLFVDSTHTVKPGSEVNRIVLEAMPRLADGVFVHFHDIWFPYDYSPGVLNADLFFWSESTLVHAFLVGNGRYSVRAALSTLHYWAPDELRTLIPEYSPAEHEHGFAISSPSADTSQGHFPSSLFLQVGDESEAAV